jgi:thymidylate synthase (FAD)
MPSVRLIAVTKPCFAFEDGTVPTPEGLMAYCARVSSPNQENPDYEKLLRYCIRGSHWSVLEQIDMTLEIITSISIATQLIRHRTFVFQMHSQRYSEAFDYEEYGARRQDHKNRQNSIDDLPDKVKADFLEAQAHNWDRAYALYRAALDSGVAKECARTLLPTGTKTRLYMKGSVRSWVHYFKVRCDPSTQLEHREVALAAASIFKEQFPVVYAAADLG